MSVNQGANFRKLKSCAATKFNWRQFAFFAEFVERCGSDTKICLCFTGGEQADVLVNNGRRGLKICHLHFLIWGKDANGLDVLTES